MWVQNTVSGRAQPQPDHWMAMQAAGN